jgi:hypothetical protein
MQAGPPRVGASNRAEARPRPRRRAEGPLGDPRRGEARLLELALRLDQVEQLSGALVGHAGHGRHGHVPVLGQQLRGVGVARADHGLRVADEAHEPLTLLALGHVLEVGPHEPAAADGVAAGAVLLEVVGVAVRPGAGPARAQKQHRAQGSGERAHAAAS